VKLQDFYKRTKTALGIEDAAETKRTVQIVLEALFARLTPNEAKHLAAQLPHQLRDRFVVKRGFERLDVSEFIGRISAGLGVNDREAVRRARAVFDVVCDAVSEGAIEHALDQLPSDFQRLLT
jgi:uncharacterized protein (DUF2267 family)